MLTDENLVIRQADPASPDCRAMIEALDGLQESLYPVEENYLDSVDELQKSNCYFLAACRGHQIVGCGALKIVGGMYSELKRMYVAVDQRQLGVGQRLLAALEAHAAKCGMRLVRLETGVSQPEALALYRRNGYKEIEAFGEYSHSASSVFMEKRLPDEYPPVP